MPVVGSPRRESSARSSSTLSLAAIIERGWSEKLLRSENLNVVAGEELRREKELLTQNKSANHVADEPSNGPFFGLIGPLASGDKVGRILKKFVFNGPESGLNLQCHAFLKQIEPFYICLYIRRYLFLNEKGRKSHNYIVTITFSCGHII